MISPAVTASRLAFAGEVRALMARQRLTQAGLADRIGISRVALGERLNGRRAFTIDDLVAIASAMDVDIQTLIPTASAVSAEVPA